MSEGGSWLSCVYDTKREAATVMVDEIQFHRAFPSDSAIPDVPGSLDE